MIETIPLEIERKFLVAAMPPLENLKAVEIQQGYFTRAEDSVEIRLRRKGSDFFLTLKSKGLIERQEYEVAISEAQFEALWPATAGRRFEKTRYVGSLLHGENFELDVFAGDLAPLVLVEVEFSSIEAAERFQPPAWFGADVSEDASFKGRSLAMRKEDQRQA
ncbi:CYTH domain-containing protein [Brucella sp. 21LCYQ03]|nr:CYTH domain-containing protein [Brucella sp. 21LCYQ03]